MLTLPVKTRRKKQPYLSIRSRLSRRNIPRQAVVFYAELRDHMASRGIEDWGPAFMRYLVIGQDGELDMEFGYFTSRPHSGGGPVRSDFMPAGTFVTTQWTGPYDKLTDVNAMLSGWVAGNGSNWHMRPTDAGIAYGCRMEIFHLSIRHVADPAQYRT